MEDKIKKKDRAFLYFRENNKGGLNIKFGPEQYTTDTKKFSEILMIGNLKCLAFLSGLTKDEDLEIRKAQYENIKISYQAIFDEVFPDVFEENKRILDLEETVIKRVEEGDSVSPEFEKKIEEAKKVIKERGTQKTPEQIEAQNEEFKKEVENKIQLLEETKKFFIKACPKTEPEEDETQDDVYKQVIINFLNEELKKLTEIYGQVEEGKAIML